MHRDKEEVKERKPREEGSRQKRMDPATTRICLVFHSSMVMMRLIILYITEAFFISKTFAILR